MSTRSSRKKKSNLGKYLLMLVMLVIVGIGIWTGYNLFSAEEGAYDTVATSDTASVNSSVESTDKTIETSTSEPVALYEHDSVPILMYHAIAEYEGNGLQELFVTPTDFKEQMSYLKDNGYSLITFSDLENIEQYEKPILVTLDDGYKNNVNAYEILSDLSDDKWQGRATIFMIDSKIDTSNGLSTDDIVKMSSSGVISFQSHTTSHLDLTTVSDFETEFGIVNTHLEELTGEKVIAVCYPSGSYNDEVIANAREYYQYAVTTNPGHADLTGSSYEYQRVRVNYSDSLETFITNVE